MKIEMSSAGALIVIPETNLEKHALSVWQAKGALMIVKTGSRLHSGNLKAQEGSTINTEYEPPTTR